MNKLFLALALFGISLFLLVSSLSAEEICSDDSNANIEISEEQSIETSEVSRDDANSDISLDATDNSTENASNNSSNNSSTDSSKVPSKFSSTKNISSQYGKRPNSLLKY